MTKGPTQGREVSDKDSKRMPKIASYQRQTLRKQNDWESRLLLIVSLIRSKSMLYKPRENVTFTSYGYDIVWHI